MTNSDPLSEALKRLPHGASFRFVDRLLALEPGVSAVGEFTLRGDESFLSGHFPGKPLMPGVLLIEASAQLAGVVAQSDPNHEVLGALKLAAVRNAKIMGSARPGQTLRLEARVEGRMGGLIQASAEVSLEGTVIFRAALTLSGEETKA